MKIPTLFGLSLLFVAITLGLMFHFYRQNKTQVIKQDLNPQNIRITNIASNSFTVSWFTRNSTIGTLAFGPSQSLGNSQNDDRDTIPFARKTHTITLGGLQPQTEYFFKIRSDTFFFPQKPLSVTTAPPLASSSRAGGPTGGSTANRPLTGTLSTSTAQNPLDILVFLQTPGNSDLSTYVDQNLNYVLPLSLLRSQNLQTPIDLQTPTTANILATDSVKSSYILLTIPQANPLPTLILGQNLELSTPTGTNSSNLLPLN